MNISFILDTSTSISVDLDNHICFQSNKYCETNYTSNPSGNNGLKRISHYIEDNSFIIGDPKTRSGRILFNEDLIAIII